MEGADTKGPLGDLLDFIFSLKQYNASEDTIEFAVKGVVDKLPKEMQSVALALYKSIKQSPEYLNQFRQPLYAPSH